MLRCASASPSHLPLSVADNPRFPDTRLTATIEPRNTDRRSKIRPGGEHVLSSASTCGQCRSVFRLSDWTVGTIGVIDGFGVRASNPQASPIIESKE
jgi:hypothetical protein